MSVVWFGLFLILLCIELGTVNLVTIWFAVGALVSCILSCFYDNVVVQFIVFIVVSILVLVFTKPFSKKVRHNKKIPTNLDRVIGMEAVVTKIIDKNKNGEVFVDGKHWTAISDKKIDVDDVVLVKKIEGVKLVVEKEE